MDAEERYVIAVLKPLARNHWKPGILTPQTSSHGSPLLEMFASTNSVRYLLVSSQSDI